MEAVSSAGAGSRGPRGVQDAPWGSACRSPSPSSAPRDRATAPSQPRGTSSVPPTEASPRLGPSSTGQLLPGGTSRSSTSMSSPRSSVGSSPGAVRLPHSAASDWGAPTRARPLVLRGNLPAADRPRGLAVGTGRGGRFSSSARSSRTRRPRSSAATGQPTGAPSGVNRPDQEHRVGGRWSSPAAPSSACRPPTDVRQAPGRESPRRGRGDTELGTAQGAMTPTHVPHQSGRVTPP